MLRILPLVLAIAGPAAAQGPTTTAITHVGVVDVGAGRVAPDMTVVIRGRTVVAVVRSSAVTLPSGAIEIDGRGKFLIPGLWDMHVHAATFPGTAEVFLPVMVAYGILGARDTHSMLGPVVALRDSVAAGTRIGPRLFVAGELVDGVNSVNPAARRVATEQEARDQVRALVAGGANFIKVYSALSRELYLAIADEAKKQGIPFAGHVTPAVTAVEASNAGQRTFEHMIGVEAGTSSKEAEILAGQWAAVAAKIFKWPDAALLRSSYDEAKAQSLFATLKRNQTWQVPTLIVTRQIGSMVDSTPKTDPELRFISKTVAGIWKMMRQASMTPMIEATNRLHPLDLELVGRMYRAGVPILAGTDFPNPYVYPGSSLHDELALLVKAGLPPAAALRAATLDPARFFGLTDSLGSVARGKVADLVLLDGNPLEAIANTRKISAVVQGGRVFDRAALDRLLEDAAAAARKS